MRAPSSLIAAMCLALAAAIISWEGGAVAEDVAPAAAPSPAPPLDAAYLNQAQSKLGFRLIARMGQQTNGNGNLVTSPASLATVLALLDLGANPEMHSALLKTLAFEQASNGESTSKLAALRASAKVVQTGAGGPLTSANAIVFDRKEQTAGLIPSIIDKAPREGGLVALNALHFKDRWKEAFDPSLTRTARFHGMAGNGIEVPMMQKEGKLQFREDDAFVAVDLPYAADRFRLVVITTRDKPARAGAFRPVADWLTGDGFEQRPGELSLPRFALTSSADLLHALDALGLHPARASPGALAGLSPTPMSIAQVLQRTEIRVDEAGTEAAAATAVMTTRAVATDFVKMTVDKPFMFALRDAQSGLVLLTGYVDNPNDSAS